mmetsp:Transcript_261/g.651  ORF Transcript_261/g.651 Transcript_261/m.651 type:complete len:625 (+) Transcript_261:103-1977(+)
MPRSRSADQWSMRRSRSGRARSSSADASEKWWDARHHAVHCRPDSTWWTPAAKALTTGTIEKVSLITPPSYAGWPTTGPGNDKFLLQTRQAKMRGHVDWVSWAMEAHPSLHHQKPVKPRRRDHPDANWWPNYGAIGPDGFLTWAPDQLSAASSMSNRLHQEFMLVVDPPARVAARQPVVAHRSAVLDLLDRFAPKHLPSEANQQWWELRTHVATASQDFLSWEDLSALLHGVMHALSGSGACAATHGPLMGALPYSDMVCTALLSLPVLNSSMEFAEARRLLKACGQTLVQRQLLLDGLIAPRSQEPGDVGPSLAQDSRMTRVARLAAGISEHPHGMFEEQAFLGNYRGSFVVALPDDGDPLPPWPPRKHRIIAARDSCSWASFDILALGVFDGDLARALRQLETLWTAAAAYTEAANWVRPAFFLRCYPRSDANIPHVHVVDVDPVAVGLPVMFGPWDLSLEEALVALQDECQGGVAKLRTPGDVRKESSWRTYFRHAAENLDQLQTSVQAVHHERDSEELSAKPVQSNDPWILNQEASSEPLEYGDFHVGVQTVAPQASTLNFYSSELLGPHPAAARLSATELELEDAMRALQSKVEKMRSATLHAVSALSDHGMPSFRGLA